MAFNPVQVGGIDTDRYGVKFNADYVWLPNIANPNGTPTEAEINLGRLLTGAIAAINGFNVSPRYDELPDLTSTTGLSSTARAAWSAWPGRTCGRSRRRSCCRRWR